MLSNPVQSKEKRLLPKLEGLGRETQTSNVMIVSRGKHVPLRRERLTNYRSEAPVTQRPLCVDGIDPRQRIRANIELAWNMSRNQDDL